MITSLVAIFECSHILYIKNVGKSPEKMKNPPTFYSQEIIFSHFVGQQLYHCLFYDTLR